MKNTRKLSVALLALLALPAFAQDGAPKPKEGSAGAPPAGGASTSTEKGAGAKKAKPAVDAQKTDAKKDAAKK